MLRKVMTLFSVVALLAFSGYTAYAGNTAIIRSSDFIQLHKQQRSETALAQVDHRTMTVSVDAIREDLRAVNQLAIAEFPVTPTELGVLELQRSRSIVDAESNTMIRGIKVPEMHNFKGWVLGHEDADVFITFVNGEMFGTITYPDGRQYSITPVYDNAKTEGEHIILSEADVDFGDTTPATCLADEVFLKENGGFPEARKEQSHGTIHRDEVRRVELYLESDRHFFSQMGGDYERMINYNFAIVAQISKIYEDELNVYFVIVDYYPFSDVSSGDPDPYGFARGELLDALNIFSKFWQDNKGGIQRNLVHLISAYPAGGGVIGIARSGAYNGTLCKKDLLGGYAVSGLRGLNQLPNPAYTLDVATMAHELGHNFGAPHTHNCYWTSNGLPLIDSCMTKQSTIASDGCFDGPQQPTLGTIMSYCFNVNASRTVAMNFHPQVIDHIQNNIDLFACIDAEPAVTVFRTNPKAGEQYSAGSNVEIRWAYSGVNTVKLEYSTDNTSFTEIATAPATDGAYMWNIPGTLQGNVWIRISDNTNGSVNDAGLGPIEIASASVSLLSPTVDEEVAGGTDYVVRWNKSQVESVNVLYSENGEGNWTTIAENNTGTAYEWQVPDVSTNNAYIRIESSENSSIGSTMGPFTIGSAFVSVSRPNSDDDWQIARTSVIEWSSAFVNKVRLEYSTNGGNSFSLIVFSTDAAPGRYEWDIPANPALISSDCIVRVTGTGAGDPIIVESQVFGIVDSITSVEEREIPSNLVSISPNPATEVVNVSFTGDMVYNNAYVELHDITGAVVATSKVQPVQPGATQVFTVKVSDLANGTYFATLRTGNGSATKQVKIAR